MKIRLALALVVFESQLCFVSTLSTSGAEPPIDRRALVTRHFPRLHQFDANNPLSVGNGQFAFTADATGLQTFPDSFTNTTPLGTLSQWGWHTAPNPEGWTIEKFGFREFDVFGRKVGYADVPGNRRTPEINWLRANPHRLHLGQIGFALEKADGSAARTKDLEDVEQWLDLWNGVLHSRFKLEGQPVEVETLCHPTLDAVAVRVKSPLLKSGRAKIELKFPYGTGSTVTADWSKPDAHETVMQSGPAPHDTAGFTRKLDANIYYVSARWSVGGRSSWSGPHAFTLAPEKDAESFEFVCNFAPVPLRTAPPAFAQVLAETTAHWNRFWNSGGAIDLSGSQDPRWRELERRIVLSQYLTAIQCSGAYPPQETGLTYNSWEGKFHLEMHWWHAAHFALWDRLPLLEKSLGYYQAILPQAQATAKRQGYSGARWPKMTNPSGAESPSPVGPFLVWQQPHPIFYAELCYRAHSNRATLDKFKDVVQQTAEFMASYPEWEPRAVSSPSPHPSGERDGVRGSTENPGTNSLLPTVGPGTSSPRPSPPLRGGEGESSASGRYVLGPVLQCAQEIFPKDKTLNPTFELTYWRWGLEMAQQWRQRLGQPREPKWDRVLNGLAKLPLEQEKYLFAESATGTYSEKKWTDDHPSVTAAFGMLPGPGVDRDTMRRTLNWIWTNWNWPDTWGWDYPMLAMCAARVGEPERTIDALLLDTSKNHYGINGHNYQRPGLTIYLPGNGGLLYAVAMMAAGWDGAPKRNAPGFPDNGKWTVRWEGLRPAP